MMQRMPFALALLSLALLSLALAACSGSDRPAGAAGQPQREAGLPAPEAGDDSVTGMPDKPGPGQVGPPVEAASTEADATGAGLPPGIADAGATAIVDDLAPAPTDAGIPEPTPGDAVAVVHEYYDAIAVGNFASAYGLWSDHGRASGQSPQQFAAGFADTTGVQVSVGEPGRVDAAAGSRYIEIPVAVTATRRDGSVHRYVGAYVLRRAMVDGATPEQRAWRIQSADIREVRE